jgi:hypothetical protein
LKRLAEFVRWVREFAAYLKGTRCNVSKTNLSVLLQSRALEDIIRSVYKTRIREECALVEGILDKLREGLEVLLWSDFAEEAMVTNGSGLPVERVEGKIRVPM